jgi:hypothetical protein
MKKMSYGECSMYERSEKCIYSPVKFLLGNLKGRNNLGGLGARGRKTLKTTF